jgi:hypothetical protein
LSSLSLTASAIVLIVAFWGGFVSASRKNKVLVKDLQEQEKKLSIFSERFYKKKDYKLSILNLFNSLIKFIQSNLIKTYGPDIARLPSGALIKLAQKDGLLKPEDAVFINDLREVRNLIAHSELPALDEELARSYLDRGMLILKKFDMAQRMPKDSASDYHQSKL